MPKRIEEPTPSGYEGAEQHPAFGMARVNTIRSTPGAVLFQSDIRHGEYVHLEISTASRKRSLNTDWVHPEQTLIEVSMSMAQWAALVSSFGTQGVPVTIDRRETDWDLPGLPYAPRLQESFSETRNAASKAFDAIKAARDAYDEGLAAKVPAAERKRLKGALDAAINNATANVAYASKTLAEHSENVVQHARADIEAMVVQRAAQLGMSANQVRDIGQIEASDAQVIAERGHACGDYPAPCNCD